MRVHPVTWFFRGLWLVLPFTVGGQLGDAVDGATAAVRFTVAVGGWAVWGLVLIASVVPRPATLTLVRMFGPAAPVAAVAAVVIGKAGWVGTLGVVVAAVAALVALSSWVADDFVDGGSYGPERRWSLRAPGALLAGPIPLMWTLGTAGWILGPLFAAASPSWARFVLLGAPVAVAGLALTAITLRSIHTLSVRHLVFVPAGLTVVDPLALAQAAHLPRAAMARVGPALEGTDALDLSQGALGLAIEVELTMLVTVVRREGRRTAAEVSARGIVVTPGRPGSLLDAARAHRLPVG